MMRGVCGVGCRSDILVLAPDGGGELEYDRLVRMKDPATELAGYRLLEFLARGAVEIFGDKTFNS